jgi:hypothetical protein
MCGVDDLLKRPAAADIRRMVVEKTRRSRDSDRKNGVTKHFVLFMVICTIGYGAAMAGCASGGGQGGTVASGSAGSTGSSGAAGGSSGSSQASTVDSGIPATCAACDQAAECCVSFVDKLYGSDGATVECQKAYSAARCNGLPATAPDGGFPDGGFVQSAYIADCLSFLADGARMSLAGCE